MFELYIFALNYMFFPFMKRFNKIKQPNLGTLFHTAEILNVVVKELIHVEKEKINSSSM